MNKHILLSFFFFSSGFMLNAQCPLTYTILHTQAEVNAFPSDCSYLNVRLDIGEFGVASDITDLTPLNQLTGCSNKIYIWFNPQLTSLNGLENLSEVLQDFTIQENHALTDLTGLEGLQMAEGLLKIEDNNSLQTLNGLTAGGVLTHVESLVVIENDNLTDMGSVFDNLQTVDEYVYIQDNASLPTLNTMNNLTYIGWYLNIENLPALTVLNAFNSLQSVGTAVGAPANAKDFEVINCAQLSTLNDFSSLSDLGRNFELSGNPSLTEISFPSLTTVHGEMSISFNAALTSLINLGSFDLLAGPLTIVNNANLPECEAFGICSYLGVIPPKSVSIGNNDPGCNNRTEIETACGLLPVKLITFHGKEYNDDVLLNWQTASEENNDYFQVEHSADGSVFKPIGKVAGNGTTAVLNNYSFHHTQPSKGGNFYRLRQVDFDGQYAYSSIVHVETARGFDVEIYPNPSTGYVKLRGELSEGTARLTDITGRLILERQLPDENLIDLTQQPEGVYLVEIQMGNERVIKRVVKE